MGTLVTAAYCFLWAEGTRVLEALHATCKSTSLWGAATVCRLFISGEPNHALIVRSLALGILISLLIVPEECAAGVFLEIIHFAADFLSLLYWIHIGSRCYFIYFVCRKAGDKVPPAPRLHFIMLSY